MSLAVHIGLVLCAMLVALLPIAAVWADIRQERYRARMMGYERRRAAAVAAGEYFDEAPP